MTIRDKKITSIRNILHVPPRPYQMAFNTLAFLTMSGSTSMPSPRLLGIWMRPFFGVKEESGAWVG